METVTKPGVRGRKGERPAVETALQRDDVVISLALVFLSPFAGGFDGTLVGFRTRIAEKHLLHARAQDKSFRERDAGIGVIEIGSVLQRTELPGDRRRPLLVAVAEDVDAYAGGEVEIAFALRVIDRPALSPHQPQREAGVGGRDV